MGTTKVCGAYDNACPDQCRTCQYYIDGVYDHTGEECRPNTACNGNGNGNGDGDDGYWEYYSTYREIDIQVWMPDWYPFTAYTDTWVMGSLSAVESAIDSYLEGEPPADEFCCNICGACFPTMAALEQHMKDVHGAKKPTSLSLTASPATGTPPFYTTLTATLMSNGTPLGYKEVEIYMRHADLPWTRVTWGDTDSSGVKSFSIHIGIVPIEFYAYFAGDSEYEESVSPTVTIEEVPGKIPAIISITVSPKTGTPPYTTQIEGYLYGEDGSWVTFATVNLYRDEEWIDSTSTDAAGFYSFTQVITEPHDFYAEFEGNDVYEGCV